MSFTMWIVGFFIFAAYMYFTIWNIFWSSKKQRKENNISNKVDVTDMDGMGDFSRFPTKKVNTK